MPCGWIFIMQTHYQTALWLWSKRICVFYIRQIYQTTKISSNLNTYFYTFTQLYSCFCVFTLTTQEIMEFKAWIIMNIFLQMFAPIFCVFEVRKYAKIKLIHVYQYLKKIFSFCATIVNLNLKESFSVYLYCTSSLFKSVHHITKHILQSHNLAKFYVRSQISVNSKYTLKFVLWCISDILNPTLDS